MIDDLCGLHSGEAISSFCTFVFYVAGLRFGYILYSEPLLGMLVFFLIMSCKYVTGLMQAGSFLPQDRCVLAYGCVVCCVMFLF